MEIIIVNGIGINLMTRGYIEAALATSDNDAGDPLDTLNFTIQDIGPATLQEMADDCELFRLESGAAVELGLAGPQGYDMSDIGYDFWMTRQQSGVGFWEPGDWPENAADTLDETAKMFGQYNLFILDDGKTIAGGRG